MLSRVDKSGHPSLAHNHITFQWRALSAVVFDWFGAWSTMHPLWWLALCFAATGVRAVSSMVRTEYVRRTQGAFTWTLPGWVRHPVVVIVGISAAAHSIFWGGFTASVGGLVHVTKGHGTARARRGERGGAHGSCSCVVTGLASPVFRGAGAADG